VLGRKKAKNIKDLMSKINKEFKRHKLWKNIKNEIYHIASLIVENKILLKELWKLNDISQLPKVKFRIDKKDKINAYIQKTNNEFDYQVTLYKGIILISYNYAGNVILKYFPMVTEQPEVYEKLHQSLFYYWITLILSHEFSHLFRKHLEVANEDKFLEFGKRKKLLLDSRIMSLEGIKFYINQSKYLETDADRFAGMMYIGIFAKTLNKVVKETGIGYEDIIINLLVRGTIKFLICL